MSREITADFHQLIIFLSNYKLASLVKNQKYLEVISKQHKKYYALLIFYVELTSLNNRSILPYISAKQKAFYLEVCSDIGNALFLMTHGAYKASRLMLRSSIETFLKGFMHDKIANIDRETNMFSFFNTIKKDNLFKQEPNKKIINSIHQIYKELCKDTHTATTNNMAGMSSLQYFPTFLLKIADSNSNVLIKLVTNYLVLMCLKYNSIFHKMHFRNKEIIIKTIPREYRKLIQNLI